MADDDRVEDATTNYESARSPMMLFMLMVRRAGVPGDMEIDVRSAYLAATGAIQQGVSMLGSVVDPETGMPMYDPGGGFCHSVLERLERISRKIPDYSVTVAENYTVLKMSGRAEWRVTRGMETAMLERFDDKIYHDAHTAALSLLAEVQMEMYRAGLMNPSEDVEESAEKRLFLEMINADLMSLG